MNLSQAAMVANIIRTVSVAGPSDISSGVAWYPKANTIVKEWAELFGRDPRTVANVIAALSPQLEWHRNLDAASDVLDGRTPAAVLRRNLMIAEMIRDDGATSLDPYFKVGAKVKSFALNLTGDYQAVTVDTHAAQIAAGSPSANLRISEWKQYTPVAEAYREVAARYGIAPATLQAIVWHTWKRLYSPGTKRAIRRRY